MFKSAVSPYQAEVPHWEQWCPQLKEAVLCALWVGSGENSYELARALIGGSPPLGFEWEYSGEAKEKAITKCKHKSQLYLLQECGVVNARSEGCRTAVDPHWETDRGRGDSTRAVKVKAEQRGKREAYLEEKIAPSSIHFAPQRWRLESQLWIEIEESGLCIAFFGSARRWSGRKQPPVRQQKRRAPGSSGKTRKKPSAKICFSHWGSLVLTIKMHAAVD